MPPDLSLWEEAQKAQRVLSGVAGPMRLIGGHVDHLSLRDGSLAVASLDDAGAREDPHDLFTINVLMFVSALARRSVWGYLDVAHRHRAAARPAGDDVPRAPS